MKSFGAGWSFKASARGDLKAHGPGRGSNERNGVRRRKQNTPSATLVNKQQLAFTLPQQERRKIKYQTRTTIFLTSFVKQLV